MFLIAYLKNNQIDYLYCLHSNLKKKTFPRGEMFEHIISRKINVNRFYKWTAN